MDQQKRIAQVCKHSWAGFLAYDVEVIGETPRRYRVRALQPFTLPSRRQLAVGDVALVPKTAVRFLEPERATQPCRRDRVQRSRRSYVEAGKTYRLTPNGEFQELP